ncbi:MAG TPA: right-handed parallel beta-helix repeat-containing protein [Polyangia bacterium]
MKNANRKTTSHPSAVAPLTALFGLLALTTGGCAGAAPGDDDKGDDQIVESGRPTVEAKMLPETLVDDDGRECPRAKHKTIAAAVKAARAGSTILVCPGTYHEQTTITKSVVLWGAQHGVDARTRMASRADESVIVTSGILVDADDVTIDGFSLQAVFSPDEDTAFGLILGSEHAGYKITNNLMGGDAGALFLGNSGSKASVVRHNKFTGRGVFASPEESGTFARRMLIEENLFEEAGLSFIGSGHRDVTVRNNTLTGGGSLLFWDDVYTDETTPLMRNLIVEGNAITGSTDAAVLIRHVGDARFTGNVLRDGKAQGILIVGRNENTRIDANAVSGFVGHGIQIGGPPPEGIAQETTSGATVDGNRLDNNASGIALLSASRNSIASNTVARSGSVGISVDQRSADNQITRNQVSGSKRVDCEDRSVGTGTNQTRNTWTGNNDTSQSSADLCAHRAP